MRKALPRAGAVALLVVLLLFAAYVAAGYWLAPRLVRDALVEQAARQGLVLEVGEVRTGPFLLTVELAELRLAAEGRELARAPAASADLAWASLWREGWVLQELALRSPWVEVRLGEDGMVDWGRPQPGTAGAEAPRERAALSVHRISVTDGTLHFVDRSRAAPVEVTFQALRAEVNGFSTRAEEEGRYRLSAELAGGGSVSSEGTLSPAGRAAQGRLALSAVPLEKIWRLSAPASEPASGRVDGTAAYVYDGQRLALRDVVLEGDLAHSGVALSQVTLRSPEIVVPATEPFRVSGSARLSPEGEITASGALAFAPFVAELENVELAGMSLPEANRWIPQDVNARIASGALSARGRARITTDQSSFEGALALREARLEERSSGELLAAWQALETEHAALSFAPFGAELGEVRAQAPVGRVAFDREGRLNFARIFPEGEASEEDPPPVTLERLRLEEGSLHFVDHSGAAVPAFTARGLSGTVEQFSSAEGEAKVALRAPSIELASGETFSARASGTVAIAPFAAELQLAVDGVPLPQLNRWLPDKIAAQVTAGRLSADGRLRLGEEAREFRGSVSVANGRIEERGSQALLLAWQRLQTAEAALSFAPWAVELGEVVAQAPSGRLVIGEDGRINLAQIFKGAGQQSRGQSASAENAVAASVRRLRIEDGTLQFADYSLENDFAVSIRELSGAITGFSTAPGEAARVRLSGRVADYGDVRIRGTINVHQPKSLANITATFRNIDLAALTPYIVRFAGYRVESGRVSAELRYRVRDGRLVGENDLAFEEVQLGEKVEQAGAKDLPLELAVALLTDAQGRITLDIPVSGDLTDPQFDLGGLVARAIRNALGKVVSAPFRALAAMFGGGGGDLGQVRFDAGAAALSPPAEEDVAQIAKALAARPRLELAIAGGYDPQADAQALRRNAVRRLIAERAGVTPDAPLDFADPKVLHAAENLYMQRVGGRLEMQALRNAQGPYPRALVDALAATVPVGEGALAQLARARAETVRAELLARGVAPGRLALAEPRREQAGKDGVATELALRTDGRNGGRAAAGGTRR